MKKLLTFYLIIVFKIFGQSNIPSLAIITSLDHGVKIQGSLEKLAHEKLNRLPLRINFFHKADQYVLYEQLNNPNNIGVIWLSHAHFIKLKKNNHSTNTDGLSPVHLINDYNRSNIANVFTTVKDNIRFLGIVGCNTSQIFEDFYHKNLIEKNIFDNLHTYLTDKKVTPYYGLRKSIDEFLDKINSKKIDLLNRKIIKKPEINIDDFVKVSIYRKKNKFDENFLSLRLVNNKRKIIAVIPNLKFLSEYEFEFYILKNDITPMLTFESGRDAIKASSEFGDIYLKIEDESCERKIFSKLDGTPFGTNTRVFLKNPNCH